MGSKQKTSLPAKMNRKIIEIEEGSVLVMTPLTLHRSVPHTLEDPRVAHPYLKLVMRHKTYRKPISFIHWPNA